MIDSMMVTFSPFFPLWLMILLSTVVLSILFVAWLQKARRLGWRAGIFLGLLLALLNPSLIREQQAPLMDVVTIVVDESYSQQLGDRATRAQQALDRVTEQLSRFPSVETSIVYSDNTSAHHHFETHLFAPGRTAVMNVPRIQHAGTIFITDGQVHDVPTSPNERALFAPVHVLLTGERKERDRHLVITQVPKFGIVGKMVSVTVHIEDTESSEPAGGQIILHSISTNEQNTFTVSPGSDLEMTLEIDHAGQNVFELILEPVAGELTEINNRIALVINGVHNQLFVLLVSGAPHAGERVWRNILKSDPSVDLVHFTILRSYEDIDSTPTKELSLIAFPVHELFEVKLNEFDLIILDQYQLRGFLTPHYLMKIAEYIRNGGALLEANGQILTTLTDTPLGEILPVAPSNLLETPFYPKITDLGHYHPVTAGLLEDYSLVSQEDSERLWPWSPWFRQTLGSVRRGMVLMSGAQDYPLLILDRVGEGRVAQLTSDHIWLWARNYDRGGPHAELLRRLIHWLMKEPELEENRLHAELSANATLQIERHRLIPEDQPVTITAPDGTTTTVTLTDHGHGRYMTHVPVPLLGLYQIHDSERSTVAAVGTLDIPEQAAMQTTQEPMTEIVSQTGGGIYWLADFVDHGTFPAIRHREVGRSLVGDSWFGIHANRAYVTQGVTTLSFLPLMGILCVVIALSIITWYREGR